MQRVILLLVVCMYFFTVSFCLQCAGDDFFRRVIYVRKDFFYLQCFLFVKAVSPVGRCSTKLSLHQSLAKRKFIHCDL